MTNPKPIIRSVTADDLKQLYGDDKPGASMRAIVVELDGRVAGIAGLSYHNEQMTAFSKMDDALRDYPVTIMKVGKRIVKLIEKHGRNVKAIASNDEPGSDKFLERLGFTFVGETEQGRVYQWVQQ